MTDPQPAGMSGMNAMTDPLGFVKNMWGSMGLPGMSTPGMSVPGMTLPTLSVEELEKKIGDLKAVEAWLTLNMTMLRGTIQAMEIQRSTLVSLKAMNESMSAAFKTAADGAREAASAAAAATAAATGSMSDGQGDGAKEGESKDASALMFNPMMMNPATWWNVVQEQFGQAVSSAIGGDGAGKTEEQPQAQQAAGAPAQPPQAEKAKPARKRPPKAS